MSKVLKKTLAFLLCAAFAASSLTACKVAVSGASSSSQSAQSGSLNDVVKFGKKLDNLSLDGTLKGQYKGHTLTIPVMSGDFEKAVNSVKPIFEKLSGANVVVESIPGDQFGDKVQMDLNNTKRYDVILSPIAFLHSYAKSGKLAKLQPIIDQYASKNYDLNDFIQSLLVTYGKYDGNLYAIPYKPDVELLFYRKDLFSDSKVQADFKKKYGTELKVPETNDDLMKVAEFFTKRMNPGSPVEYGYSTNMLKGCTRLLFINRGGDDVTQNLKTNFNNDSGLQALNRVLQMQKYAPKEWMQMGWDEANQFFANGNAAMMEQWPGLWNTCQADGSTVKDKIGVAVTPGKTPVLGGWGIGVADSSKEKELAWKFVEFATSKDGELMKIENTMDPCRTSTYEIEGVKSYSPLYQALKESLGYAKTLADVDVPYASAQLNDVMELHIQDAMSGKDAPKSALDKMDKDFQKLIKSVG